MAATYKVDARIHDEVLDEFAVHPLVDPAAIEVAVDAGLVTLTRTAETFPLKWAATDAAQRVPGVRRVQNELAVGPLGLGAGTDAAIAAAIKRTLALIGSLPVADIRVAVRDGRVTLTGSVDHTWQRPVAYYAALGTPGVRGVACDLAIAPLPLGLATDGIGPARPPAPPVDLPAA